MRHLIAFLALLPCLACWTFVGPREPGGVGSVDPACREAGPRSPHDSGSLNDGGLSADANRAVRDAGPLDAGVVCGNGSIEGGEACDDGNRIDTDACTNACQNARCGDGIVRQGVARGSGTQCNMGTDECSEGERCFRAYHLNSGCSDCPSGFCHPDGYEECDDGNEDNGDFCYDSCLMPSD